MLAVIFGAKFGTGAPSPTIVGKASVAMSRSKLSLVSGLGKRSLNFTGPLMLVLVQTSCCMARSGVIHGPPLPLQPGSLFMLIWRPRRLASEMAWRNISYHSALPKRIGPGGMFWETSMSRAPPMPTRCTASRSAVIPSQVIFPSIQNQLTQGRAESGG